jgi:hypothetical protein
MGPLSAVAVVFYLVIAGLTGTGGISASPHTLGWIALICAALVLLDTFLLHFVPRYERVVRRREVTQ